MKHEEFEKAHALFKIDTAISMLQSLMDSDTEISEIVTTLRDKRKDIDRSFDVEEEVVDIPVNVHVNERLVVVAPNGDHVRGFITNYEADEHSGEH